MDRQRFLIRGIDDYEWALEATGLHLGYSVDIDIADGLLLDTILPSPDGRQQNCRYVLLFGWK